MTIAAQLIEKLKNDVCRVETSKGRINNIARHADATRVAVLLQAREKEVSMIVEDNGRGFSSNDAEPLDKPSKRLGLLGIRERLSLVSGTLEVESAPVKGCTLYIRVPL